MTNNEYNKKLYAINPSVDIINKRLSLYQKPLKPIFGAK